LGKKWYIDGNFIWLNTPFRRFFGYGSHTLEADESNYVSHGFYMTALAGYYATPRFRINLTESFISTDLKGQAIFDVADTLTRYGGLNGVQNSFNFIHKVSLTYDSRPKGPNSREGFFAEGSYFASLVPLGSDVNFHGFSTEAIHMHSMFNERTTLVFRLFAQDIYGSDVPFYLQSSLGGDRELRAFIPNRFVDNGKLIFTWEQRIKVLKKSIFGIPAELWLDPFLEAGTVFDNFKNLGASKMQTVAGLGIRMIVPPTVVGRIDIACGAEGYSVYTQLGYPF
jgi:outer membrane protein assembly factor BamA